jgi:tetratricopeptide (TPR) repeat protein
MRLYLDQGRGEEAVAAAKEAERWRARQPPSLRDQILADKDAGIATLFLMAGRTQPGLDLIDRALARPDRRGLHAVSSEQTMAAHAMVRRALRRSHREVLAERATYESVDPSSVWASLETRLDEAADAGRVIKVLGEGDRLVSTLRLFVHGGVEPIPVWLVGDLVEIAGAGVIAAALDEARAEGNRDSVDGLSPYYDAIDAEVRRVWGDHDSALTLAERALAGLPESEVALRARVAAVASESAESQGDGARALEFLSTAVQLDPGVLRRRGRALPVRFETDAGSEADAVVDRLRRSPRFDEETGAFRLRVEGAGPTLSACLFAPAGERVRCVAPEPERQWVDADGAVSPEWKPAPPDLVRAVHHEIFAIALGLSAVDMGSLDGTATVSGERSRQRLQRMLDDIERE